MKWKILILAFILPFGLHAQDTLSKVEFWFDGDFANREIVNISDTAYTFDSLVSTNGLTTGLHFFNCRFGQKNLYYSTIVSKMFIKMPVSGDTSFRRITAYEYWFDSAYSARVLDTLGADSNIHFVTELNQVLPPPGLHTLNIRFKDNGNIWSSTLSKFVLVNKGSDNYIHVNAVTAMRYWVDTFVSKMDTIVLNTPTEQAYILEQLNLSNYDTGDHYIQMQFRDAANYWSSVIVDSFYQLGRPRIDNYTPKIGGNTGDVTVFIYGNGFTQNSKVRLTKAGQFDITAPDSMLFIHRGTRMIATFDLRNRDTGMYDLVVEVPGDTLMIIQSGFHIIPGNDPNIKTIIVGNTSIRVSTWQDYSIVISNEGAIDAHGVPLWITIPDGVELIPGFKPKRIYDLFNVAYDPMYDSIPEYYVIDTTMDAIEKVKIYGYYFPILFGGQNVSLNFKIRSPTASPVEIKAWTEQPYFGSPVRGWVNPCWDALADVALGFHPAANCWNNLYNASFQTGANIVEAVFGDNQKGVASLANTPEMIARGAIDCALGFAPKTVPGFIIKTVNGAKFNKLSGKNGIGDLLKKCGPMIPPLLEKLLISPVMSFDPNAKYGPQGNGLNNYIVNPTFPYKITYENDKEATAWAQTVRIVDTLDTAVIDRNSFELGFIQLADSIINIPNGKRQHKMYIDLRPQGNDVIVQFDGGINDTTGIVQWLFQTLDPITMEPTTDPLAGFVPPNVNAPEGEGGVFFTVKLKEGVANNTVVRNRAYIYFDNNDPIATEPWVNTIDNIKPHSSVNPLPSFVADTIINVSWKGIDTSSGVMNYTVYVSENNKPYEIWRYKVSNTADTFIGKTDSSYAFYSVATDTAGNVEDVPLTYDAITKLVPVSVTSLDKEDGNMALYPNPTGGTFTIEGVVKDDKPLTLTIYNVLGQSVLSEVIKVKGGKFKHRLSIISQPSGQYSLLLKNDEWSKVFKLSKL